MARWDCHLQGAPRVSKSGEEWQFSSEIRASVHYSDLAFFGLEWSSRDIVCCGYGPRLSVASARRDPTCRDPRPTVHGPLLLGGSRERLSVVSLLPSSF